MTSQLNRDEILDSIQGNVQDRNMIKHMLATEAIMRALARKLGEVEGDMGSHSRLSADIAKELGASPPMTHAVLCHNEAHGVPRETKLDKALFCADPLSGLITAAALVRPDKLTGLTSKSVMKRFREKSFAAGVNRQQVALCQEIGLELEEFMTLGIEAMQGIASELGL
jgi:predicted hydrolase (HD superfamily)